MDVERLLAHFESDRAEQPAVTRQGGDTSYGQLARRAAHWRAQIAARSWAGGAVGLATDYSPDAIALLLALLAERKSVALLPRDRSISGYLSGACVSENLELAEDELLVQPIPAFRPHAHLHSLQAAGDAGLVIFSSGSSGAPKAALHSAPRFLSKFRHQSRRLRTLAFLMFDHVAGQDTLFYTLCAGGTLVIPSRRDPATVVAEMADASVEVLPTSPTFLRLLCATTEVTQANIPSLKFITYGSEPMDPTTLRQLNERFPGVSILQKYGTTETGSPRTESRSSDSLWLRFKAGGDGNAEISVRNGILWLRASNTLIGYLNAPDPVDADGWYCTGDRVERDGEWFRILGRETELINVGGEKVAPSEVEEVIREVPSVGDVAVSGEPNGLLGCIVAAKVVLRTTEVADAPACVKAIRRHCRSKLAPFKVPIKIEVVPSLSISKRMKRVGYGSPGAPKTA